MPVVREDHVELVVETLDPGERKSGPVFPPSPERPRPPHDPTDQREVMASVVRRVVLESFLTKLARGDPVLDKRKSIAAIHI